jgi:hypothetical protein
LTGIGNLDAPVQGSNNGRVARLRLMESLDRFFEVYERLMPPHFGDVMVAVVLVSLVGWIAF